MGIRIPLEPLTHEAFAAFGSVLEYDPNQKRHRVVKANQGSADKVLDVSVMADAYAAKAPSRKPGRPVWNLFYARQRALRPLAGSHVVYDLEAVERHPYTTQTFVPLARRADEVAYVVVVSSADPRASNWAQLAAQGQVRAFYARGNQAVTYGAGTWHSPMIAVGEDTQFATFQFENGVGPEDCDDLLVRSAELEIDMTPTVASTPRARL